MLVYGIATLAMGVVFWLGPLGYGLLRLQDGDSVVGWVVTALGAVWAVALARDATLPGMLAGAVHSILIFAGLAKDPWEGDR